MVILNIKPIDIPNFALVSLCLVIEKLPSPSVNPVTKLGSNISIWFWLSDVKLIFFIYKYGIVNHKQLLSPYKKEIVYTSRLREKTINTT